ncbi:MAG TPA: type II toxin-antitoxin system mRNA interferase toxin, RelE/StbE family [Proteobacteria bacterium]|nr:type II toxin-antitoxin system mRNA interferase toxin, RelE/StbE family [Pseudomonadota bacterium]
MFRDEYHPQVKNDLKKVDKSVLAEVKEVHIPRILIDPYSGENLTGNLSGIYSYHFKKNKIQYRISYIIEGNSRIVYILMIGKRESFYRVLKRRLN